MVGVGGPTAGGDDALKMLYDLDSKKHRYHIIRKMTVAQSKEYKARVRKKQGDMLYVPESRRIIYRTVGKGRGRRVIAMRKQMNWRGRAGKPGHNYHSYKNHQVKPWFGDHDIMKEGEKGRRAK